MTEREIDNLSREIGAMPPFEDATTIVELAKDVFDQVSARPGYERMAEHARLIAVYFQVVKKPEPSDFHVGSFAIRCAQKILSDKASEIGWERQNAPASTAAN